MKKIAILGSTGFYRYTDTRYCKRAGGYSGSCNGCRK